MVDKSKSRYKMLLKILGELKDEPVKPKDDAAKKKKKNTSVEEDDDGLTDREADDAFTEGSDPVPGVGVN